MTGLYAIGITVIAFQLYIIFHSKPEAVEEKDYGVVDTYMKRVRHGLDDDRSLSGAIIADPVPESPNLPARPDPLRYIRLPGFSFRFVDNRTIDAYGHFVGDMRVAVVRVA